MSAPAARSENEGLPKEAAQDVDAASPAKRWLEDTVRAELRRFSGERDGLASVWAWSTASTRGCRSAAREWIGLDSEESVPAFSLPETQRKWTIAEAGGSGWHLAGPVDESLPQLGQIIARFSSRTAAENHRGATEELGQTLRRAVRQLREENARRALAEFPTSPASLAEARSDLLQIAKIVQRVLDVDGAKIYLLRRSPEGPMVWRLCNTKEPEKEAQLVPLLSDHGMADWVLREGKWLLLPDFQTPVADVEQLGVTAEGALVTVIARPATEHDPLASPDSDSETSVLLVPLTSKASVAGVLSVWREDRAEPPLDEVLDRESLEQFAPHIAAACQRLLQLQKAEEQLAEMSRLARVLAGARTLREGYEAVAAGTGKLADAACALLLHHNHDAEHGHRLYPTGLSTPKAGAADARPLRAEPALRCGPNVEEWQAKVEPVVRDVFSPLTFRGLLTPPTGATGEPPPLTVALFDSRPSDIETEFPYDQLLGHFARAFLQAAAVLLERHAADLASHLADELGGPPEGDESPDGAPPESRRDPQAVLEHAGSLLRRATGADAALLYMGTSNHMKVFASVPSRPGLLGLLVNPNTLTRQSLHDRKARLVLEAGTDFEQLNKNQLDVIARELRWREIRSWLCCPVFNHGAVLGMVKLLTNTKGEFLGKAERNLAVKLSKHAAWEMYKVNRRQVLESLGVLSREIAAFTGRSLGEQMASRLRTWAVNHLLRPECKVVVLAQVADGSPLVRAAAPPKQVPPFSDMDFERLEALSSQQSDSFTWGGPQPTEGSCETLSSLSAAGAAHTVKIAGVSRLKGHILFADKEIFSLDEQEAVREAARAMAVLLNAEAERNEFKQTLGHFRHATLGPIQGVQSNALVLADLATEAGANPEETDRCRTSLLVDLEALRLWRHTERIYLADKVDIRPNTIELRPLVKRCFERYYAALAEREIEHRLEWLPEGKLQLELDEHAFDIALSNLLDNARKYSFRHREVVVEVRVLRDPVQPQVQLMVEDIGHGIDESRGHFILEKGQREMRFDPFRIIPGEGLGLPMTKAIVDAHHGELSWNCKIFGSGKVPDTTPYRVRFFITLPFHQPRRPK